jgi:RNA polymerase sigma-70 factor (sigma-E family)
MERAMSREPAFSAYVAARRATLFRTACLLCGDPHLAEDIVQDTLARLYANWSRVSRADNVEGYVRRVLVNSHYSDRRRPWRRESTTATSVDLALEPGMAPEDADAIWTAIRSLPAGQRKVVVLRHIWDRSVEETAADLGISTGTVKSQTRDALAALRRALTSDFGTTSLQGEER